jgi:acetyltransferase-like isoleucine patch superfamily enzyme
MFKNVFCQLKEYIACQFILDAVRKKNPTCKIYQGAEIDKDSVLGKYNVIFQNVAITHSRIGDHTYVQKNAVIMNADIGKFCSLAGGIHVGLSQHASHYVSTHPAFYLRDTPLVKIFSKGDMFDPCRRVRIGHDVWIGQNAMIMGGVIIGTGAIIAAGAVVTKDVPEYAVAGGVPAKILKYRFEQKIREGVIRSQWWDKPQDWLEKNFMLFKDPGHFINKDAPHGP